MTFRRIISLLKPNFTEDGSNERLYQNKIYNIFVKYLREAGSTYFAVVAVVSKCFCQEPTRKLNPIKVFSWQPTAKINSADFSGMNQSQK